MKKIAVLLLSGLIFACSADDAEITSEQVSMFVDHYQTTNYLTGTAFVVQVGDNIGSDDFRPLGNIAGFNFEPGNQYRITALKTVTKNEGTDFRTAEYALQSVVSQEAVDPETTFRIPLSVFVNDLGFVKFLERKQDSSFALAGRIPINCNRFCTELNTIIDQDLYAVGTFKHGEEGSYVLTELEN